MPSLLLFKRRWMTGSDDLVLPGILLAITHFILFVITANFVTTSSELNYWSGYDLDYIRQLNVNETTIKLVICAQELKVYSYIFVALLITATLLEIVMTGFSMQGTVLDAGPRKPVEYMIYIRIVLGAVEIFFSIATIVHLSKLWDSCQTMQYLLATEAAIVGINFISLLIVLLIMLCIFDSSGRSFYRVKKAKDAHMAKEDLEELIEEFHESYENSWKASLRRCCCCLRDSSNTNVALDEVSYLLKEYFKDMDVVPSDIAAGMVLLRHKQQCLQMRSAAADNSVKEFLCGRPITNKTKFIDPTNSVESKNLSNLIYYCNYAAAAYGPLFYLVYNPMCGLCELCHHYIDGAMEPNTVIEGNRCCSGWYTSSVSRAFNDDIHNATIVYASWKNDLFEQPFFITVDFDKKAIVVTIRGTLSEMDALVDIVATPTDIPVEGNDGSLKCHKGMKEGAYNLKKQLVDGNLLANAFAYDTSRGTQDFQLVLVGHSLGAGIASVASIMLKPLYPTLECYSYSPPGGLLSLAAMRASRGYIMSAVYGKDLVTRTGIVQLQKMRVEIVELLKRCKKPKYRILLANVCQSTDERHSLVSTEQLRQDSERLIATESSALDNFVPLFPPGRIYHIVYRRREKSRCQSCFDSSEEKAYYAIEADNTTDFNEILISHNMVTHHWPLELLKAMKKVLRTPIPDENCKNYSQSETIPSHVRLNNHDEGSMCAGIESDRLLQASAVRAPSKDNPATVLVQIDSKLTVQEAVQDKQELEINANRSNAMSATSTAEQKASTSPASDIQRSNSLVGQFHDYIDAVLPDSPHDVTDEITKAGRSLSLPPQAGGIDSNTLKRAQFEANLIPKPPRSNSMLRRPSPDMQTLESSSHSQTSTSAKEATVPDDVHHEQTSGLADDVIVSNETNDVATAVINTPNDDTILSSDQSLVLNDVVDDERVTS